MSRPTMDSTGELTDEYTLNFITEVIQKHFPISASGYRCETAKLWHVLISAAVRHTTIESTCKSLENTPDANTVRGYLKA